jgi:Trypsin-co-occurring domain 2
MIELSELISALRWEVQAALAKGEGETLRFEAGPVELEVTVSVERAGSGTGKIRFWVLEAGTDGKLAHTTTQRIMLTLQPKLASGESPLISGQTQRNER